MNTLLVSLMTLAFFSAHGVFAATVSNTATSRGASLGDPSCTGGTANSKTSINETASADYFESGPTGCTVIANATAGLGLASAFSGANSTGNASLGILSNATGRASALFNATNLFFTPDEGFTNAILSAIYGDTIEVTLFATLSGNTSANTSAYNFYTTGAGATVEASVRFGGATWTNSVSSAATSDNGTVNLSDTDVLAESISLSQTINWGQGSQVTMGIGTKASVYNVTTAAPAYAVADGSNTLSFNIDGPAFALPEGFTVNAPELNIFNNRWIDPRVTVAPVPLPAGLPLLLAGIGALGLLRLRGGYRTQLHP